MANLRVYEQIFRLDVPMNDVAAVTKSDALDHLVNVIPQTLGVYAHCVFL